MLTKSWGQGYMGAKSSQRGLVNDTTDNKPKPGLFRRLFGGGETTPEAAPPPAPLAAFEAPVAAEPAGAGLSAPEALAAEPTACVFVVEGEKDVERYAIFRRLSSVAAFNDPISSIPVATAAATYSFKDTNVIPDSTYVYGIAAQDCTPLLSSVVSSPVTTVLP